MSGLSNGLAQLFKQGRKRIGNAIDNFWVDAEAKKAISDEVGKKFQPFIDRANRAESRRATNITELGNKLTESKKALQDAKDKWQQDYDAALAEAKNQRQKDINDYDTQLQTYQDALKQARAGRQSILDQLQDSEAIVDPNKTLYIDITTGKRYILDPTTGTYKTPHAYYKNLSQQALDKRIRDYETRLFDSRSNTVINPFDEVNQYLYKNQNKNFDGYLNMRVGQNSTLIRDLKDADNQVTKANADLTTWQNNKKPTDWDDNVDLKPFKKTYEQTKGRLPKEYSFNGQTYSKKADLDKAYQDALSAEQTRKALYSKVASGYVSKRDKEIAKRIQDAKDIKKAKLALGTGAGAGALFAGAAAMYGGDDTDNTDNTDNTTYGEPDPNFNVENIPEGQAPLKSDTASIDTGFDPDKADALASAAYDQGVEDGNSARSSGDLVNSIAAATGGHTMDDRLFELIKAMKDPYKADAIANYIYSRHGDDPEVQRLGWRGWLNKYYGDSLRSKMNIDPSGYKGMHISGGL